MEPRATEILRQVFPDLDETGLTELVSVAQLRTYPSGTVLCHEGCIEDTFYIIVDGRAEVCNHLEGDAEIVLHRPGPGEFFGEIALVQEGPRIATVRTAETTTVLEIGRQAFTSVLQRSASMAVRIMLQVTSRLRDGDQRAITDLRHKNIELAQAYAELDSQQRLRSAFLTTIAHELRTPLTAATGYLQLVNSGAVTAERQPEFLKVVANNLDTVVHLVNSILFLQELDLIKPEFKWLDIEGVVLKAVEMVQDRATEADLTISTRVDEGLPEIKGNANGLRRAVGALLENAVKFSPEGGEVFVRVRAQDGTLRIEVCDPGIGFPMEQQEDVFKPFTRIEATGGHLFGGVGLGLPIARQVVELHGGHIEIASAVGKGSTFTIVLPIPEEMPT